jgi:WD40 repeat protein
VTEVLAPPRARAAARAATPYMGLVPYGEDDAAFFFGRSEEKQVVIGNLRAARLTILYGPSGVGKTSLIQAGVLHDLRAQVRDNVAAGRAPFAICAFRAWREDALPALVDSLHAACTEALGGEELPRWTTGEDLEETLRSWTQEVRTLLVVLDEFQDYFLYHPGEHAEGTFAYEFPRLVNDPNLRVHFLVSLREDALARLDRFTGQIPRLFANYLRIDHLDREGGHEAIVRPLEEWNRAGAASNEEVTIEASLVEAVLDEVETGKVLVEGGGAGTVAGAGEPRIEAPYLQLVLNRLWAEEQRAGSRVLRLQTLTRLGGARRIISTHLDTTMAAFPEHDQDVAARAFQYLVTPSGTKIAHRAGDLADLTEVPLDRLDPVLERLAGEPRILRHVGESAYEIYHDALAGPILAWRSRWRERRERRRERRRAGIFGLAAILLALVAAGFLFLFIDARHARERAQSRELAARANALLDSDPQASLALAVQAVEATPTEQAQDVLRASLEQANVRAVLRGHRRAVTVAAFSPDGRRIVTASDDGTARIWDTQTGRSLHVLRGHTHRVTSAAFSTDGRLVATASRDGTARLWSADSGKSLHVLPGHAGEVSSAVFSPDGRLVITADRNGTARVWDTATGKSLRVLRAGFGSVRSIAFSPDGRLVATVIDDATMRVWDVGSGRQLHVLRRFLKHALSSAFSPDGRRIVAAYLDGYARVWDVATGRLLRLLRGHDDIVLSAAFSPDGKRIVTSSGDGTARLWEADSGRKLFVLRGHSGVVYTAGFSPDGGRVVTAGEDGTARIWDVETGQALHVLRGHSGVVYDAAFSPDGRLVVTTGADGTARIWDARAGSSLRTFRTVRTLGLVYDAALSPDGRLLLTAGNEKAPPSIWNSRTGRSVRVLRYKGVANSVAFSPDGRRILIAGEDGAARVWDSRSGRLIGVIYAKGPLYSAAYSPDGRLIATTGTGARIWSADGHGARVLNVDHRARVWFFNGRGARLVLPSNGVFGVFRAAFSPDSRTIVTAAGDGTATVWDARTGRPRNVLSGTGELYSAAFSPDGRLLVTGGSDGTPRVWDTRSGKLVTGLVGHSSGVSSVAFSPDGRLVITGGSDKTARVWVARTGTNVAVISDEPGDVRAAAFSADGTSIVTATIGGTIHVYPCAVCGSLQDLRARAREQLARAPPEGAAVRP